MNLFNYFKENIHMDKIKNFTGDTHDMAIVRYVMKEAAKFFYRDYTFFFYKENIKDRDDIYNKKIDMEDVKDFAIVCKSYCNVIKEVLKQNYDINSELISPFDDKFRHVDLLIKTRSGSSYIVDPLTDLIEMQVGMKTNNFASREYYDSVYAGKLENISFMKDKELNMIDDKIDYKKNDIYLDDFLKLIRSKLDNIEEILSKYQTISIDLLGKKYDGETFSNNKKTQLKLEFISKYLNNRKNLNGTVDLLMYFNIVIKELFTEGEQKKIQTYSFFVDEKDLEDSINDFLSDNDIEVIDIKFSTSAITYLDEQIYCFSAMIIYY